MLGHEPKQGVIALGQANAATRAGEVRRWGHMCMSLLGPNSAPPGRLATAGGQRPRPPAATPPLAATPA